MLYSFRLDYDEFRRQLGKAGTTAREFAALLGLNPNSITNYANRGAVPTHLSAIAVLMAEMAERGLDYRLPLAKKVAPLKKRPRGAGLGKFGGDKQQLLFTDRK